MPDVRIIDRDQNHPEGVRAASLHPGTERVAQVVVLMNPTGDLYTASGGGSGGDGAINDGADENLKATVRDYTNSNPLAVVLTNPSGDVYSPVPNTPLLQTAAGRVTSAGSNSIVAAVTGKRIKVTAMSLQGDGDNARGFFANGASGERLTTEWEFASREGVVRGSDGGRSRGYLFATGVAVALSFESSSSRAMKYGLSYFVEDTN